ncbi:uncharacterized protein LOC144477555 [Augochlora pura]
MFESTRRLNAVEYRQSWRPWRATNLLSLTYPNILFSRILGIFPYKYRSSEIVFSKTRFVFSVFTLFIYISLLSYTLYYTNVNIVNGTVESIDRNIFLIWEGILVLALYVMSHQRFRLLKNLRKLSRILSEQDFQNMALFVHTKDIVGIVYLLLHLPNCIFGHNETTTNCLTILYVTMVYLVLDMAYVNCVYVLRACFIKINENLKKLNTHEKPWLTSVPSQKGRCFLLLVKLKHYEELHEETSDVVQCLNKAFLFRIIVGTIVTFTVITFNVYYAILWYGPKVIMQRDRSIWLLPHLEVMTFYFAKFTMMVVMCESAKKKAQEIGTTIHEILDKCTDETVRRELRMFALQVMHRDNRFCARAIAMDTKLLTQIVGGVIMYNLILFQFLLNGVACGYVKNVTENVTVFVNSV